MMPDINDEKKPKITIRTIFYHNTFVLIFSLVCAIILWFSTTASNTQDRPRAIYDIPITIQLSDAAQAEGIRVFSQSYTAADVSVTGSSLIVNKVTADDISVVATLSPNSTKLSGNTLVTQSIALTAMKNGNTLADYEVASVNPEQITVAYDRYKESTFKIENNVKCTSSADYYVSTPTISDESVVVSGPESAVNKVKRVSVDYNFTEPVTESKKFSYGLTVYDENDKKINLKDNFLTLSVETVDVDIAVLNKQTVDLNVNTLNVPQGFADTRISIDPVSIDIAGDLDTVSKYKTITLPDAVDFSEVNLTNNVFKMEIPMPSSVKNVSNVTEATVTINLNGFKETQIPTTTFKLANVPDNKTVTVITKSLAVDIVGSTAQISRLTSDAVYGNIDMASLSETNGNIDVPVTISISGSTSCWVYGKYSVQVKVEDKKTTQSGSSVSSK